MIKVLEGTIHDIQSVRSILEILCPNHESAGWYHSLPPDKMMLMAGCGWPSSRAKL